MSYILDALKKAEKECQRGTVPTLSTIQHTLPKQKKHLLWPYIVFIALLITFGVLFFGLNFWKSKDATVVAKTTVSNTKKLQTLIPSPEFSDSQSHNTIKSIRPEEKVSPEVRTSEEDALIDLKSIEISSKMLKTIKQNQATPLHTEQKKTSSIFDTRESSEPSSAVKELRGPTAPDALSAPDHTNIILTNRTYTLQTLPASIKENLPPIHISVFVYSDDPNSRIVKINGQSIREGQDLAEGLRVEEIVSDGVIFNYEAYRFHVGIK
jgi:general secretion pathway protein B